VTEKVFAKVENNHREALLPTKHETPALNPMTTTMLLKYHKQHHRINNGMHH